MNCFPDHFENDRNSNISIMHIKHFTIAIITLTVTFRWNKNKFVYFCVNFKI